MDSPCGSPSNWMFLDQGMSLDQLGRGFQGERVIQACCWHITSKCYLLAFSVLSSCCPLKKVLSNVCLGFFSHILRRSRSFVALFTRSLQSKVANDLDRLRIRLWFLWCGHHFGTCKSLGSSPVKMSHTFNDPSICFNFYTST